MSYNDADGLLRKYGTEKVVPVSGGEYKTFGANRVTEILIDLTTLTTSPVIQNDVLVYPSGMFLEQVEIETQVAATGGTSFSVGLIGLDRSTVDSNTKFVNAALLATHDQVGEKTTLTTNSTGAGSGIGAGATNPGYITALAAGTYTAGKVLIRLFYHGYTTITK
jgi:hypothetical protein